MKNMTNTIKQFLSSKLNLMRFSTQVFVMGIILSLTFFLLAIESFKTYRSDILILVNIKSDVAERQSQRIISNIIELPQTLSFYDRLLKFNPDVRDVAIGLSSEKRKQKWNEMFSIQRSAEDNSVIKISMKAKRENDAQQLASKSARTLFDSVAFYYDIKKDVDLRIIDGPISKSRVPFAYGLLALSIIAGFAFATLLKFIFIIGTNRLKESTESFKKNSFFDFKRASQIPAEKEIESLNNLYQADQAESQFVFEEEMNEQLKQEPKEETDPAFQEIKDITKKLESSKYPNYSEMPIREPQQPASAPDNLPIADEHFIAQYQVPNQNAENEPAPAVQEEAEADTKKEPTPEELKKRLNQLLRGEL